MDVEEQAIPQGKKKGIHLMQSNCGNFGLEGSKGKLLIIMEQ